MQNTCEGHRARIKRKFKSNGLEAWHDYEILELGLFYAIPYKDTKLAAKKLLSKFKTLEGVLNADIKDLCEIKGVSEHTALFIKFLKHITKKVLEKRLYEFDIIASPSTAVDYFNVSIANKREEKFVTLFLNSRNKALAVETLQTGTVGEVVVYPRKIAERALYHSAAGVIIAHNHPGGSLAPSKQDKRLTKRIKDALQTIDVLLLDHIIVTGTNYYSWKEQNML
ncbi:DNA repair protein RadC [bacterium]